MVRVESWVVEDWCLVKLEFVGLEGGLALVKEGGRMVGRPAMEA